MDSDEENFLTCEVCDLPFTGIKPFEQHMKGKQHQKRLKEKKRQLKVKPLDDGAGLVFEEANDSDDEGYTCKICETTFSGIIPFSQHLKSKPHFKALRRKKAEEQSANLDDEESDSELLEYDDDDDLSEILKDIAPKPFGSCSICKKDFSGPESYSHHMKSKSHVKRKCELQLLRKIKSMFDKCQMSGSEENVKERSAAPVELEELECEDCEKGFTSAVSFAQHLTSKAHERRQNRSKMLEEVKAIMTLESDDDSSEAEDQKSEVLTCKICNMAFSGPENAKAHVKSRKHQKAIKWKKYVTKKLAKEGKSSETYVAPENPTAQSLKDEREKDATDSFAENDTGEPKDEIIGTSVV